MPDSMAEAAALAKGRAPAPILGVLRRGQCSREVVPKDTARKDDIMHPPAARDLGIPVRAVTWVRLFAGTDADDRPCLYAAMGQSGARFMVIRIDCDTGECTKFLADAEGVTPLSLIEQLLQTVGEPKIRQEKELEAEVIAQTQAGAGAAAGEADVLKVECPQCGRAAKLPRKAIGRKARCPHCRTVFRAGQSAE